MVGFHREPEYVILAGKRTVDYTYIAGNDAERKRLKALVERLSDEELKRPMSAGWTVAGVLAHVVFSGSGSLSLPSSGLDESRYV